jgi:hypothetical protein
MSGEWADPDVLDASPIPNPDGEPRWPHRWAVTRLLADGSTLVAIEDSPPETLEMHQVRLIAEHVAKRRAPLEGKTRERERKIARASELHAERKSAARIGQIMLAEGLIAGDVDAARSVRRWLHIAKSRTDRERSDSR